MRRYLPPLIFMTCLLLIFGISLGCIYTYLDREHHLTCIIEEKYIRPVETIENYYWVNTEHGWVKMPKIIPEMFFLYTDKKIIQVDKEVFDKYKVGEQITYTWKWKRGWKGGR